MDHPFLDKYNTVDISTGGNLPHWHQAGKIQFVTFRLADSLPDCKIQEILRMVESMKKANSGVYTNKIKRYVYRLEERYLDGCYGACILLQPCVRRILIDSLHFNDNKQYRLFAYVVMPNHVHLLIQPLEEYKLGKILQSIKGFSSRKINQELNRTGNVWMREYYDHIIRDNNELKHCVNYICNNPRYLKKGQYELYLRE